MRGFAFGDEQETWYKELGFPGTFRQFSEDMERRKRSITNSLKEGHWTFFGDLKDRVTTFHDKFLEDLHEVFDF